MLDDRRAAEVGRAGGEVEDEGPGSRGRYDRVQPCAAHGRGRRRHRRPGSQCICFVVLSVLVLSFFTSVHVVNTPQKMQLLLLLCLVRSITFQ